jgi:hypothetical protein
VRLRHAANLLVVRFPTILSQPATTFSTPAGAKGSSRDFEGLFEVRDQVLVVLDANREPDEVLPDPSRSRRAGESSRCEEVAGWIARV